MAGTPSNFQPIYDAVIRMRRELLAPVDVAGCHAFGGNEDNELRRFRIFIALILSPMTKDQVVARAMENIHKTIGCDIVSLSRASREQIDDAIKEVNMHPKKANHIKECIIIMEDKHNSKVPSDMKSLLALPGVGTKIAALFMNKADNAVDNIAVDTHLSRIFQRWGWAKEGSSPINIAREVQQWLPRPLWRDINQIVVGFGQVVCNAGAPLCGRCLARHSCPTYARTSSIIATPEAVVARGPMADIEDIAMLRIATKVARDKLVEEHGLPEMDSVWLDSEGRPIDTHWL